MSVHIFLDESGTFGAIGSGQSSISVQGALILASHRLPKLFRNYARLRTNLPKSKGEVKGSLLNEAQVAAVIDLLRRNEGIFCASMIDTGEHTSEEVEKHRKDGLQALAANLTNGQPDELRANVIGLQRRMATFSPQLYCQMMVTLDLLHRVLEETILYHCQRHPKELAEFHWIVDAKAKGHVTDWEDWWANTLVVWLQAISLKRPANMLRGGDYRHFRRFMFDSVPEYLQGVAPDVVAGESPGFDLQLIFRESFRFSSDPEPGLELADIVTNAMRRGLIGNLGEAGWLPLKSLMIHRTDFYVRPVTLRYQDEVVSRPVSAVLHRFREGGRNMLTEARYLVGTRNP